jgi:hypothetical protein
MEAVSDLSWKTVARPLTENIFKSAILAIFQFFQNGTFDPLHEISNLFCPKAFF